MLIAFLAAAKCRACMLTSSSLSLQCQRVQRALDIWRADTLFLWEDWLLVSEAVHLHQQCRSETLIWYTVFFSMPKMRRASALALEISLLSS